MGLSQNDNIEMLIKKHLQKLYGGIFFDCKWLEKGYFDIFTSLHSIILANQLKERCINNTSINRIIPIIWKNRHTGWKLIITPEHEEKHVSFSFKGWDFIENSDLGIQKGHLLGRFLGDNADVNKRYIRKIINDEKNKEISLGKKDTAAFFTHENSYNIIP